MVLRKCSGASRSPWVSFHLPSTLSTPPQHPLNTNSIGQNPASSVLLEMCAVTAIFHNLEKWRSLPLLMWDTLAEVKKWCSSMAIHIAFWLGPSIIKLLAKGKGICFSSKSTGVLQITTPIITTYYDNITISHPYNTDMTPVVCGFSSFSVTTTCYLMVNLPVRKYGTNKTQTQHRITTATPLQIITMIFPTAPCFPTPTPCSVLGCVHKYKATEKFGQYPIETNSILFGKHFKNNAVDQSAVRNV